MTARYDGPIVDAHHHLWMLDRPRHPWLAAPVARPLARDVLPGDYRATFAGRNIVATVWIEALAADAEEELRVAAGWRGDGLCDALVGHAPLDAADLPARLDRMQRAPGFCGVRDIVSHAPGRPSLARAADLMLRPGFREGLRELARRGLSFELMLLPHQLEVAAEAIAAAPGLRVAVEHAGSPVDLSADGLARWQAGMARLAEIAESIVKVSALQVLDPRWTPASLLRIVDPLAEIFGPGRMCFGSDFPTHDIVCPGPVALDCLLDMTAEWPAAAQRALFCDTAMRFYRIGEAPG